MIAFTPIVTNSADEAIEKLLEDDPQLDLDRINLKLVDPRFPQVWEVIYKW